jgi:hypothetical protein
MRETNAKPNRHPTDTPTRYLTRKECTDIGINERWLDRKIKTKTIKVIRGPNQRNGKPQTLIEANSLVHTLLEVGKVTLAEKVQALVTEAARKRLGGEHKDQGRVEEVEQFEAALQRFRTPEQKEAARRRCLELEALVQEFLALAAIKPVRPKDHRQGDPAFLDICRRAAATDPVWLEMYPADARPPALSTFSRWVQRYLKEGKVAFLRQPPALDPSADARFHQIPQEALDWLYANLRNYTDGSKRILISHLGKAWLTAARREKWPLPWTSWSSGEPNSCYAWLRRWVRKNVPDLARLLIVQGERRVRQTVAAITRRYDELRPWEAFTADWRPFDVIVNRSGKLLRLNLCPVIDLASRAIAGFCITEQPSARAVRLAVLDAIRQSEWKKKEGVADILCGLPVTYDPERPAFIHFDNGKEFTALSVEGEPIGVRVQLESSLEAALRSWNVGLANDVQLKLRHARPFSPRGKLAEWFYTYVARWEKTLPGYRGRTPDEKPYWFAAAWRTHERLAKRKDPKPEDLRQLPPSWLEYFEKTGSVFPLEDDFRDWFVAFVLEYLHSSQQSLADAFGRMSPIEFLRQNPHPIELPSDWALAQMLMEYREVTVRHGEIQITWAGQRFKYWEPEGGTALAQLPHRAKVEFRFDPAEIGRGWVFYEGKFLTVVEQPELLSWRSSSEDLKRTIKRQQQYVKFARQWVADALSRGKPELIHTSIERAQREQEREESRQAALAPITRITRYDSVPKSQRARLQVVKTELPWLTPDDLDIDEPTPSPPPQQKPWKELWED